jgi:hypothetical protein
MRVQDDGDRGVPLFLRVVAAFEAAFWAGKDDFGHLGNLSLSCAAGLVDKAPAHN